MSQGGGPGDLDASERVRSAASPAEDLGDDDDDMSFTSARTVASNVTNYRYENGRRYHAFREGTYYGPNDDKAAQFEVIAHHIWLLSLEDKLFLAPIENPEMILDVGTGTGLWAIDMADRFPSAEIIATDLSPIQATTAPPNIRFEVDDASSEWTYPESSFDFVHMRTLTGCIKDWKVLYDQCYKHVKPGGYCEHLEVSCYLASDPSSPNHHIDQELTDFTDDFLRIGEEELGQTFCAFENMEGWMRDAGFTPVRSQTFTWPIGPWHPDPYQRELGTWGQRYFNSGFEGWILAVCTRYFGWSYERVQAFIRRMRAIGRGAEPGRAFRARVVWGRKPL